MGSGESKTTTQNQVTTPWSGQQPYLSDAFNEAQNIYQTNKAQNTPGYQGNFVNQASPDEVNAMQGALNWSSGAGPNAANGAINAGNGQIAAGQAGLANANAGLTDFQNKDWTGQHIADAGQYANNPFVQGMIDSSMRDAQRSFSEDTMRGINQNAAATGNMNSTRAGVSAGIAQRGLADKTADVSSAMRGAAWNTGLQASQADQQSLLSSIMGQGNLAQGQMSTGLGALGQASDMQKNNLDQSVLASSMLDQYGQNAIDNGLQKFQYQQSAPWSNLANYWNVVGDKSWGGTTTGMSKQQDNPSTMSSIGSGVAILGSLFRCDARCKNILAPAGITRDGLPLYLIQYKDAKHLGLHITPLAQDVQAIHPEAVREVNGVLHIDTSKYDWR